VRKAVELTSGDLPFVREPELRVERSILTGRQKSATDVVVRQRMKAQTVLRLVLAFMEEYRGEAPKGLQEGTESYAGERGFESPAITEQLMEEVCGRENCKQALKRVKANKGSAGVDGMTVQQLPEYLKQHWPAIREQLLSGTYKP
jgi:RNA-directed DNA polymerase